MHKSSSMENNSCLLACRLYRLSGCVSWLVIMGKRSHEMDRVKFWHTNKYGRGVCMSVSNPSKRWRVRLSIFTNTPRDLLGVTDIKRKTVWPISTWVCRRDYICTRKPEPGKHAEEWLLTSCSGDSCSMSAWRHLRPGRKWLPITSSEITAQEVKDQNGKTHPKQHFECVCYSSYSGNHNANRLHCTFCSIQKAKHWCPYYYRIYTITK